MIPSHDAWRPIDADSTGMVNLGRAFGAAKSPALATAWLKTVVIAKVPMPGTIHLGFAAQGTLFLNGRLVFAGNNPYYPSAARLSPGGRIGFDNAVINSVSLKA